MKRLFLAAILLAAPAQAQTVTMPQSVVVAPYRLAVVEMTYDGDDFAYSVPPELDAFREYTTDPQTVRLRVQFVPRPDGPQSGTFQITAVAAKAVDGVGRLSKFQTCLVNVAGPAPPIVTPPDKPPVTPPIEPPDTPPQTPTAATYIYEKDDGGIPSPVLTAIDKINREKKIVADFFEDDTVDGTGQTPQRYKSALAAARASGLPALVVTIGPGQFRIVKDPRTEAAVFEAIK